MIDYPSVLSRRAARLGANPIQDLFSRVPPSQTISFAAGAPDSRLLPVDVLHDLVRDAVTTYGPVILQYGPVQGFGPLIDALIPRLQAIGIDTTPGGVHITTGATGALHAVCAATLNPGDRVAVAEPSYGVDTEFFRTFGAHVIGIPADTDGVLPDALAATLATQRARLIYLMPTFANPTGATMPPGRRADIAAIAHRYNAILVEDDAYSALRYHGETVPSLHAYAPEHTVYIGSMAKTFAPAARIGYIVAPQPLLTTIMRVKTGLDMQTSVLTQALATQFLTTHYDRHITTLRTTYAARLDALCQALTDAAVPGITWHRPDGGMFVWLQGPPDLHADAALLDRAAHAGVLFLPGHHFFTHPSAGHHTLRLAFAALDPTAIRHGIARLAAVLSAHLTGRPTTRPARTPAGPPALS